MTDRSGIQTAGPTPAVAGPARTAAERCRGNAVVSSPVTPPPLDLNQVANTLASLRPGWTGQGLTAGPLTWRDACASWPKPLLTDRSLVAEPESVGLTMTTADGCAGRLVIWRGGWADIDLLDGDTVTSRNPAIRGLARKAGFTEARCLASQLTAPPALPGTAPARSQPGHRAVG